jgi:tRNA(Ile)-lysidine synthase
VLVGVSGGADSVALTFILRALSEHGGFSLAGLAHFNHQLRATAVRDQAFCQQLAGELHLPFLTERADVAGYAETQRISLEDAARRLRYDFLERTAAQGGADRIAVGHTLDDQAETVLLKLARGAGLAGLGGIYPQRGTVVRPLLDVTKGELQSYLRDSGRAWIEDETNVDLENPRNRIRHVVLPELERAYPGASRAMARASEAAREDVKWLEERAQAVFAGLAQPVADGLQLDVARLTVEPKPIVRRVLLIALRALCGNREIGLDHIRVAEEVLNGSQPGADLPGARLELRREMLVLSQQGRHRSDTLTR